MADPAVPRVVPDVTLKPSGKVTPATPATMAALLLAAMPGDRVTCDPSLPWVGPWSITRPPAGARVIVSSSREDVPVRFLTATPQPVFTAAGPVGGVHFLNCEITLDKAVNYAGGQSLVQLGTNEPSGQQPRSFVFERCHVFGNPGQSVRRGILANCADFAFIDGRVSEIHQKGADAQAICGWSGAVGHLIRDSVLEASGENLMYGGSDSTAADMSPRDITIQRVTLSKPLAWAGAWTVKNLLEFKNAERVLVDGLVAENNWVDAQDGHAILLTPRNQGGGNPWSVVRDITLRNIRLVNSPNGFNILGRDNLKPSELTERILIDNVLCERVVQRWMTIQGGKDVAIRRVTALGHTRTLMEFGAGPVVTGLRVVDSVLGYGQYFFHGDGLGSGVPTLTKWAPDSVVTGNTFMGNKQYMNPPPGNAHAYAVTGEIPGQGCDLAKLAASMVPGTPPPAPPTPAPPLTLEGLDRRISALEQWKEREL